MSLKFNVKAIVCGNVEGEALVSLSPLSFYGGVDRKTGIVVERGHPLETRIYGRVFYRTIKRLLKGFEKDFSGIKTGP